MPKLIYFYFFRRFGWIMLLSFVAVFLMVGLQSVIGELDIERGKDWNYIFTLTPFVVYDMIPFACVIGTALGIQSIVRSNEMTIINSIGVSLNKLILLVALVAGLGGVFNLVLIEYAAVPLHKIGTENRGWNLADNDDFWLSFQYAGAEGGDNVGGNAGGNSGEENAGGNSGEEEQLIVRINGLSPREATPSDAGASSGEVIAERFIAFKLAEGRLTNYVDASALFAADGRFLELIEPVFWQGGQLPEATSEGERLYGDYTEDYSDFQDEIAATSINAQSLISRASARRSLQVTQLWQTEQANKAVGLTDGMKIYEIWHRLLNPLNFIALALMIMAICLGEKVRSASLILRLGLSIGLGIVVVMMFKSLSFYAAVVNPAYGLWGALLPPLLLIGGSYFYIIRSD